MYVVTFHHCLFLPTHPQLRHTFKSNKYVQMAPTWNKLVFIRSVMSREIYAHDTTVILPYSYTNGDKNTPGQYELTAHYKYLQEYYVTFGQGVFQVPRNYNAKNGKLLSLHCAMSHLTFIPT